MLNKDVNPYFSYSCTRTVAHVNIHIIHRHNRPLTRLEYTHRLQFSL